VAELEFFMGKWEPFSDDGAVLKCIFKKKNGKRTRQANVIIWKIINPDFPQPEHIGKYFIIEPSRKKGLFDYIRDGPLFENLKDAKPLAEKMLHEYISKIMHDEINWWTKKEAGE